MLAETLRSLTPFGGSDTLILPMRFEDDLFHLSLSPLI